MMVRVERLSDHVARVTIDRPPVNAIVRATQRELTAILDACAADLDVRAVVLTGAGGVFCAGADLREERSLARDQAAAMLADTGRLLRAVRRARVRHPPGGAERGRRRSPRRSPLSVEATKDCLNRSADLSSAEAGALQVETFARLFRTRDHAEALAAFFETRPATYERR